MDYHEATDFIFGLRRFRPSPGTKSTRAFLEHLGNPHEDVAFVQVAGSNGKGSTARMLDAILGETELSVGLFTSPHLEDVRERIRIDGRKIPKQAFTQFATETQGYVNDRAANGNSPTFFETMTTLALWYFGQQDVDVAILEVGIGGRYDATSVVDPVASAVTTVSLEHTGIIGETIEEIAEDKAQVAPADAPLVTGTTGTALETVRGEAESVVTVGEAGTLESGGDPDVVVAYEGRTNHAESAIILEGRDWSVRARVPMLGRYQAQNAGVAATLARQVTAVDEATIARGLGNAHWPGRFEVMGRDPLVVLDGAHNPGACRTLEETLASFDYDDLTIVFGAMHDKDHREMAAALPTPDRLIACEPTMPRAEDRDVLARVFEDDGVSRTETVESVPDAVETALDDASSTDCVLITGSLFVVAEARWRWTQTPIPRRVPDTDTARDLLERETLGRVNGIGSRIDDTDRSITKRAETAANAVHHTVSLSLSHEQARIVERELVRLGGDCHSSSRVDGDTVSAVLMGTETTFNRLCETLDGERYGLPVVARVLRSRLDLENVSEAEGEDENTPQYPWSDGPCIMGILNVTPDSFHDGGRYDTLERAVEQATAMVDDGAAIIDVGGESTRPGGDPVSVETECERVVPVIERLADLDTWISVDTRRADVAEAALEAGADIINDVSGLGDPGMRYVAAEYDVPVVLMHSINAPVDPTTTVTYDDVVDDVIDQLRERLLLAERAGLERDQIVIDPGIGFGKSPEESFELLSRLEEFRALGCPLLVGHSHKSLFEHVGCGPDERLEPTVAATALAVDRGADVIRVHDVAENVSALRTARALRE